MKNGKRPTKREKIHINSYKLNPENWLIYKKRMDDYIWFIVIQTQYESFQVRRVCEKKKDSSGMLEPSTWNVSTIHECIIA